MDEHLRRKERIYNRRGKMGLRNKSPEQAISLTKRNNTRYTKSPTTRNEELKKNSKK